MSAYAVAHLRSVTWGPDIVDYLTRIDATLEPHGGEFVVHGSAVEVLEGPWPGDLVVIAFPDRDHARAWYSSPDYQAILGLRTGSSDGSVVLVDGVAAGHRSSDLLRD